MAREGRKVGVGLGGAGHCRHIPETPMRLSPCPCPGRSLVPSSHPRPPPRVTPSTVRRGLLGSWGGGRCFDSPRWESTKLWGKAMDRFNPRRIACLVFPASRQQSRQRETPALWLGMVAHPLIRGQPRSNALSGRWPCRSQGARLVPGWLEFTWHALEGELLSCVQL